MCLCIVLFWKILHPSGCAVSQWETSILKWPNMACPTSKEAPDGRKLLQCIIANGGLVQPANERPVCCPGVIWITHAVGTVRNLAYLAFACHMRWTGEVSIIITLDWENGIRVVKRCMTFESGPECILTLFWAIYALVLIQCGAVSNFYEIRDYLWPVHGVTYTGRKTIGRISVCLYLEMKFWKKS